MDPYEQIRTKIRREGRGSSLSKFIYIIKLFIFFVIAIVVLPVIFTLLSPFYLFRWIVFKSSTRLRPELGKMLSSRSSMLASDTIYNNPKCVIVGGMVMEKSFTFDKFLQLLQKEWIEPKLEDNTTMFPELTQYITTWLGYLFWKPDPSFRIENHVKLYQRPDTSARDVPPVENQESLTELMDFLVKKSFDVERSPWEIVIVKNYRFENEEGRAVVIFRWHHSLMDGLSCFNLISRVSDLSLDSVAKPRKPKVNKGFLRKLGSTLSFIARIPYESLSTPVESLDSNPWHLPEEKLKGNSYVMFPEGIPMEKVHELKSDFGVSFSAVVFSFITAGLRNFMLKTCKKGDVIPEIVHVGLPFPYPGHPDKLRNHMAICTAKLPVGMEDPVERLLWLDDHLQELSDSTIPFMSFHIVPFIGSLPLGLLRELVKNKNTTVMFSNMPGPAPYELVGEKAIAWSYTSGHGPGCVGFSIFAMTYNGRLRFSLVIDSAIAETEGKAKELSVGVLHEAQLLSTAHADMEGGMNFIQHTFHDIRLRFP